MRRHSRRPRALTQSPSGKARHPASVAVAPLISPSRVEVSAEKPGGAVATGGARPAISAHPVAAARSGSSSTEVRIADSKQSATMTHPCADSHAKATEVEARVQEIQWVGQRGGATANWPDIAGLPRGERQGELCGGDDVQVVRSPPARWSATPDLSGRPD